MRPILAYGCINEETVNIVEKVDKDVRVIACETDSNAVIEEAVLVDGIVGESLRGKVALLAVRQGANGATRIMKDDRDRSNMISLMIFIDFASKKRRCSTCSGTGVFKSKGFCRDCRGIGSLSAEFDTLRPWIERARVGAPENKLRIVLVCSYVGNRCAACGDAHPIDHLDERLCARCVATHMNPRETVLALAGVNFTVRLLDDVPGCVVPDVGLLKTAKDGRVAVFGESHTAGSLIAEMHHEPIDVADTVQRHMRLSQSSR